MPEMNEKDLDEYLEKLEMSQLTRGWIDEMRYELRQRGILLVANTANVPTCFGVDFTKHDMERKAEIRELQEQIAKQSELIRGYDDEILRLKAQCQKLTDNERTSYQRLNGDKNSLPTEPIKIADWMIDKQIDEMMKYKETDLEERRRILVDILRKVAQHLLIFCGGSNEENR